MGGCSNAVTAGYCPDDGVNSCLPPDSMQATELCGIGAMPFVCWRWHGFGMT